MSKFTDIVTDGAAGMGISLPAAAAVRAETFYNTLTERSKVMNLTTITGEEESARLHFLDSMALLAAPGFPKEGKLADVGTGAGFPGMPILIARPELSVTLLDSLDKRVEFLKEAVAELGLEANCVHARAEEFGRGDARDSYDAVTSRAVARLNVLCELCLPLVKPGGAFFAMKSADAQDEILEARNAAGQLGAHLQEIWEYTIPGTDIVRKVAIFIKDRKTPELYPRRYARILKKPL